MLKCAVETFLEESLAIMIANTRLRMRIMLNVSSTRQSAIQLTTEFILCGFYWACRQVILQSKPPAS